VCHISYARNLNLGTHGRYISIAYICAWTPKSNHRPGKTYITAATAESVDPVQIMSAPPQLPPEQLAILAGEDLGPQVLGVVITFTLLALICVCLRFFARLKFTKLVGWEDYFIACSMVRMTRRPMNTPGAHD
jgi:hypothetical protein